MSHQKGPEYNHSSQLFGFGVYWLVDKLSSRHVRVSGCMKECIIMPQGRYKSATCTVSEKTLRPCFQSADCTGMVYRGDNKRYADNICCIFISTLMTLPPDSKGQGPSKF